MEDNSNKTTIPKKKYILYFVAIIFVVAIAFTTTIILNYVYNQAKSDNNSDTSAQGIMSTLNNDTNVTKLFSNSYQKQSDHLTNITYKLNDYAYAISIQATKSSLFTAKSPAQTNDTKNIQNTINKFMSENGLASDSYKRESQGGIEYLIFKNDRTVCQLSSSFPTTNSSPNPYHELSCTDKDAITKEYAVIKDLLTIYNKSVPTDSFSLASRASKTSGNKSYSLISIINNNNYKLLLFAAIDGDWEYLGDLRDGDKKYASGQYIITPELRQKMSDSKYGTFILDDIEPSNT